jgi:hypothetical protein
MMPDQEKFDGCFQKNFRFFYAPKNFEGVTDTSTWAGGGSALPPGMGGSSPLTGLPEQLANEYAVGLAVRR